MSRSSGGPRATPAVLAVAVALVAAACSGPVLANPPAARPSPIVTPAPAPRLPDPQPVVLPRDDAPHERLTEWWYYTGHLQDDRGGRWGFEFVIFRAERGGLPVSWASHLALTDETGGTFRYAERSEIGPQVDVAATTVPGSSREGFALAIRGGDASDAPAASRVPWAMTGEGGDDELSAAALPGETRGDGVGEEFALDLRLSQRKPAVLHDEDGWVDFGPAGGSYYYSRTSMSASGSLRVGTRTLQVSGSAWFDHQWGDFIAVGGGGWDWFAINLADGTDLTFSLVRAEDGTYPLAYGTLVRPDGTASRLAAEDFRVDARERWTSPSTGTTWPAGWRILVPAEALEISLRPTVPQQELDTRATTGVVYWEGSQHVTATRGGVPLEGEAYVELTGYAAGS